MNEPIRETCFRVRVFRTRAEMGAAAAADAAACFRRLLEEKPEINLLFAAAPSQNELLAALAADKTVEWNRIHAFHMDEYVGLDPRAPQGFGNFLRDRLFGLVPFASVHYIDPSATDAEAECARYTALLREHPLDAVCMGIGENGHVAFNDPPVADFHDAALIKPVPLDPICRMQQVHDGCFARLEDVPTHAFTLTVPALASAKHHFCVVPAKTKAEAVRRTVYGAIGEECPATMLRLSFDATLYLDPDSASLL